MLSKRVHLTVPVIALTAVLLAACAGTATTTTTIEAGEGHEMAFSFGEPADASGADRTVEIVATDDFRFNPADVSVSAGETISFRIVNTGQLVHDFTLGDQATQDEHEEEMAEMGGTMMHDEPNAVAVAAGEAKEVTWRFTEPGIVLIGCHQPGHYDAGMKGEITVEP